MSYAQAIFLSDDFSVAAIGALMESRTIATNKLYYYTAQFVGDAMMTLQDYQPRTIPFGDPPDAGPFVDGFNRKINGIGAPLKIQVTRDTDGRVKTYSVVNADGTPTAPANKYSIDSNTGEIRYLGPPAYVAPPGGNNIVGYVEMKVMEGGALSQVQQDINSASAVITTFSNLIAANKSALKSVLNVIR
jgi:hypothetical protein